MRASLEKPSWTPPHQGPQEPGGQGSAYHAPREEARLNSSAARWWASAIWDSMNNSDAPAPSLSTARTSSSLTHGVLSHSVRAAKWGLTHALSPVVCHPRSTCTRGLSLCTCAWAGTSTCPPSSFSPSQPYTPLQVWHLDRVGWGLGERGPDHWAGHP